ncbi:hypothetical protein F4860DRAFT_515382 [Xylaria cubensis]|nr:hypothetical protein F4860DRAFT_515382 [Xylaria cubensis]
MAIPSRLFAPLAIFLTVYAFLMLISANWKAYYHDSESEKLITELQAPPQIAHTDPEIAELYKQLHETEIAFLRRESDQLEQKPDEESSRGTFGGFRITKKVLIRHNFESRNSIEIEKEEVVVDQRHRSPTRPNRVSTVSIQSLIKALFLHVIPSIMFTFLLFNARVVFRWIFQGPREDGRYPAPARFEHQNSTSTRRPRRSLRELYVDDPRFNRRDRGGLAASGHMST